MCARSRRRYEDDDDLDISRGSRPPAQGFWAGVFERMLHGFVARLIGVAIAAVILGGLCCAGMLASHFAAPPPPFLGEWDSITTKVVQHPNGGDNVPEANILLERDHEGGFGSFMNEKGEEFNFTWHSHDKDKKTIVFVMDIPGDAFWRGIPSPATFTYDHNGNRLTLVNGKESITFQKVR
ncbi:MAG TPA: hypothetical protein VFE62_30510 [Gemmataceae bacterium]|nr:hypothetical protein [Gemmataceae bacterium]